jgi:sugar lactone lactonase YvrE
MPTVLKIALLILILLLPVVAFSQLLAEPESVAYDPASNSYFVSNCGDGFIIKIDSLGNQSHFSFAFGGRSVLGLNIQGDTLLAAISGEPAGLAGLSLTTTEVLFFIEPPDVELPNDIAVDRDGIIYMTDCEGYKIYRFVDLVPSVYFTGFNYPNGILYDEENHSLLVVNSASPYEFRSIDIADSSYSTVAVPPAGVGILDGLVMDSDRNVYFTSWNTHSVHKYDSNFTNPPTVFSADHSGPADICIDAVHDLLCIPNYDGNTVDFVPLHETTVDEEIESDLPSEAVVMNSYPNPFNPETTITFDLNNAGNVTLIIYDINGKEISKLANGWYQSGDNQVTFDGADLPSGTYFAKISGKGFELTKKLHLLK